MQPALPLILIACTGNVCRSPMAEALMHHHLQLRGVAAQVGSCGLDAPVGRPPHPFAIQVNAARGVPINEDKTALLCEPAQLKYATLLLVMENHHRHQVMRRHAWASGKTFLLGHWQNAQIPDPLHQPIEAFEAVYDQVDAGCRAWVQHALQSGLLVV